ncbi:uncharacterized protein METZ01_LOCUS510029 [marine metagenome]|uniref:Uncharacterized protein n=1 Tax=marine metagenome TaxID=408172 RepID=A0A383ELM3_9ZZZZ
MIYISYSTKLIPRTFIFFQKSCPQMNNLTDILNRVKFFQENIDVLNRKMTEVIQISRRV